MARFDSSTTEEIPGPRHAETSRKLGRAIQSPVGTTPAGSTMRITVRSPARVR